MSIVMRKIHSSIILCLVVCSAWGQDVRSTDLTWSVSQLKDLNAGKIVSYTCEFKTHGVGDVQWLQKQSTHVSTLTVNQVNGSWNDVKANGQIIYNITTGSQTGTFTLERTASGVFIILDISQPNGTRLRHQYTVSQISESN